MEKKAERPRKVNKAKINFHINPLISVSPVSSTSEATRKASTKSTVSAFILILRESRCLHGNLTERGGGRGLWGVGVALHGPLNRPNNRQQSLFGRATDLVQDHTAISRSRHAVHFPPWKWGLRNTVNTRWGSSGCASGPRVWRRGPPGERDGARGEVDSYPWTSEAGRRERASHILL